jgi:hypothetical protein
MRTTRPVIFPAFRREPLLASLVRRVVHERRLAAGGRAQRAVRRAAATSNAGAGGNEREQDHEHRASLLGGDELRPMPRLQHRSRLCSAG